MATFTNQARLSYNGIVRSSNITIGEIADTVTVTKTAIGDTYTIGSDVTYAVTIVNNGTAAIPNITLTDDLGATVFGTSTIYPLQYNTGTVRLFVNGILQDAPAVTATAPLTITGISVPAGGNATVLYEATITNYAPLDTDGSITNSADIASPGTRQDCPNPISLSASATITPAQEPDLSITKSLSPTTVPENGQVTYTFLISNSGNTAADASDNVVVTDTFTPILTGLTATLNGETLVSGTDYTYDTVSGEFATTAGAITVPAATYAQNPTTGEYTTTPGTAVLIVKGTI